MEENKMKRIVFLIFTCVTVFSQSFSQNIANKYIKETLEDISNASNLICYNHRLSHEKDKQYLSKEFVYDIPLYMENVLNKYEFKEIFLYNLSQRFTREQLLEISSSIQVLSFKLDIYNELYDIYIITKGDANRELTEEELDMIIECLKSIRVDFNTSYLEQEIKETISIYKRPFGVYSLGRAFWESIHVSKNGEW